MPKALQRDILLGSSIVLVYLRGHHASISCSTVPSRYSIDLASKNMLAPSAKTLRSFKLRLKRDTLDRT